MKRYIWSIIWISVIVFVLPSQAFADDAKARAIMQKVEHRDNGDHRTADMEMVLIDKRGKERLRKLATFTKETGPDTYGLMFFLHPADVKGTAFLNYDYDDPNRDDDQWLYLPALRKTKRIASSNKSRSFMGSDLNYSDMTDLELENYDYYLKKEMTVRGHKVWMIESIPRNQKVIDETGYTKSLLFVRQDNYYVVRGVSWVHKKNYLKYMDVVQLKQIEGIWIGTEIHVFKKKGKQILHKTILRWHNVKFNQGLDDNLFTTRRMEARL